MNKIQEAILYGYKIRETALKKRIYDLRRAGKAANAQERLLWNVQSAMKRFQEPKEGK